MCSSSLTGATHRHSRSSARKPAAAMAAAAGVPQMRRPSACLAPAAAALAVAHPPSWAS